MGLSSVIDLITHGRVEDRDTEGGCECIGCVFDELLGERRCFFTVLCVMLK